MPQEPKPVWSALHKLWTKAVGTPDYDKKEWQAFELLVCGTDRDGLSAYRDDTPTGKSPGGFQLPEPSAKAKAVNVLSELIGGEFPYDPSPEECRNREALMDKVSDAVDHIIAASVNETLGRFRPT